MIAYIDSSVLLRRILGQPRSLREWRSINTAVGSAIVEVECLRALDHLRLLGAASDRELATRREAVFAALQRTTSAIAAIVLLYADATFRASGVNTDPSCLTWSWRPRPLCV